MLSFSWLLMVARLRNTPRSYCEVKMIFLSPVTIFNDYPLIELPTPTSALPSPTSSSSPSYSCCPQ